MNEPLTLTFKVEVEKQVTELEMCLLILRLVRQFYPRHFDIALEALQTEYRQQDNQAAIREEQ